MSVSTFIFLFLLFHRIDAAIDINLRESGHIPCVYAAYFSQYHFLLIQDCSLSLTPRTTCSGSRLLLLPLVYFREITRLDNTYVGFTISSVHCDKILFKMKPYPLTYTPLLRLQCWTENLFIRSVLSACHFVFLYNTRYCR